MSKDLLKIYETNSGLGYLEKAYFIKVKEGYLVIDTLNISEDNDMYIVGDIVSDFEDYELEESSYSMDTNPLKGNYFFEFFLKNFDKS